MEQAKARQLALVRLMEDGGLAAMVMGGGQGPSVLRATLALPGTNCITRLRASPTMLATASGPHRPFASTARGRTKSEATQDWGLHLPNPQVHPPERTCPP